MTPLLGSFCFFAGLAGTIWYGLLFLVGLSGYLSVKAAPARVTQGYAESVALLRTGGIKLVIALVLLTVGMLL